LPFEQIAKSLEVAVDPPKFAGRGDPSVPVEVYWAVSSGNVTDEV
jgi:hypothetical protein